MPRWNFAREFRTMRPVRHASRSLLTLLPFLLLLAACGDDDAPAPDAGPAADAGADAGPPPDAGPVVPRRLGPADRRAEFVVPPAHDGVTPLPLMVLLHGYSATAGAQDLYFRAAATARARGYYLILPDGTIDREGNRFWNATPACCNFGGSPVDDVAYLTSLLDEAESVVPVDTARVYFYGHSNGGFMSYRMACELSERITAIVSLAGADFAGEMDCVPGQGVSVLQVHGTMDDSVDYAGTPIYTSARAAAARWAGRNGCDVAASSTGAPLDLVDALPGAETSVEQWQTGCAAGLDAELWTIADGSHIPVFNDAWPSAVADWLLRHSR
jgi:polyhydroxybutyrate depolymerase